MGRSKYGNKRARFGDREFASRLERDRYMFLLDAQRRGVISDLRCQVPFELAPEWRIGEKVFMRAVKYVADFTYTKDGFLVIEDTKGYATREFRLKFALMHHLREQDVRIVRKAGENV